MSSLTTLAVLGSVSHVRRIAIRLEQPRSPAVQVSMFPRTVPKTAVGHGRVDPFICGLEDIEDIIQDLEGALSRV